MNTRYLLSTFLAVGVASFVTAQSFQIANSYSVHKGFSDQSLLQAHLSVLNTSGSSKSVLVERRITQNVKGSANNFCWGPACYPDFVSISPTPTNIASAGQDTTFRGDYAPLNTEGETVIEYLFYDQANVSDSVGVTLYYRTYAPPTITGTLTYCTGDSATITAGSVYDTYLWSTGDTVPTIKVVAGTYTVTVTLGDSTRTAMATVQAGTTLTPMISGATEYCQGDNVTLDVGPGYDTYAWSSGGMGQMETVTQGSYDVTVTQGACTGSTSMTIVNENVNPATPNLSWNGVVLSSSAAPSYQWWQDGFMLYTETSQTTTPPANGNYMVTVCDSNGCSATASMMLNDVGLDELAARNLMVIFPNPASDYVIIRSDLSGTLEVRNALAQVVHTVDLSLHMGNVKLNTSTWETGMYFVSYRENDEVIRTAKVLVTR